MHVQAQRDIIFELRRIAFDVECEPNNSGSMEKRKSMYTRDYKKLGFIVSFSSPIRCALKEATHTQPLGSLFVCILVQDICLNPLR